MPPPATMTSTLGLSGLSGVWRGSILDRVPLRPPPPLLLLLLPLPLLTPLPLKTTAISFWPTRLRARHGKAGGAMRTPTSAGATASTATTNIVLRWPRRAALHFFGLSNNLKEITRKK